MPRPSKTRKRMYEAPNHVKSSRVGATLAPDLREKYGVRSVRVRKNDAVRVLRGEYRGVEGKIIKVIIKSGRVNVEGVTREKIAGGNVPIAIHASNVRVTNLSTEDKWRKKKLEGGKD